MLLTPEVLGQTDTDIYRDARVMFAECDSSDVVEQMQSLDTQALSCGRHSDES